MSRRRRVIPCVRAAGLVFAAALSLLTSVPADEPAGTLQELWVDNVRGTDTGTGTRDQPLAAIDKAIARLKPGMTLHVVPTTRPYPGDVRVTASGTAEAPIVIDGQGALVSGRRRLPATDWKAEGDGVFSRPLRNNAWGMETHWEGGFPLVWFDGKPGTNAPTRNDLAPLGYFLYKNRKEQKADPLHNTLFIRLPAGKTFDDIAVESVAGSGGIYVGGSYVTVRGFVVEYGGTDGYATHRGKGIVFENVEARYFMDQGMSHHGAEVLVRDSRFHHNAGGGVVDVYPEARVRYERCLVDDDTWRGGVEFHSGRFEMVDCVIRGNPNKALLVTRGARAVLRNCLLVGDARREASGVTVSDKDSVLEMEGCTLYGFSTGINASFMAGTRVALARCAFYRCTTNLRLVTVRPAGADEVRLQECFKAAGNLWEPAPWLLSLKEQPAAAGPWKVADLRFGPDDHARFAERVGSDTDAVVRAMAGADDPSALPLLENGAGQPCGARLPAGMQAKTKP